MPNISITENLREIIKQKRKESGVKGGELSDFLKKGKAYISQLENGKIKTIEISTLVSIFRNIVTDMTDKEFDSFMQKLLDDQTIEMTDKELEHEKWMLIFNFQIRRFPIEESLINFIKNKMESLKIDAKTLATMVNQNIGLSDDEHKIKDNQIYIEVKREENGFSASSSIKFNIPEDTIEKMLSGKIKTSNYVVMQGIIWNLFQHEDLEGQNAHKLTHEILYKNNFLTLSERKKYIKNKRQEKIKNNEAFDYLDILPTQKEREYQELLESIISKFNFARDKDITYTCERLEKFKKTIKMDLAFILALIGLPFYNLEKISKQDRSKLLHKIANLIEELSKQNNIEQQLLEEDDSSIF